MTPEKIHKHINRRPFEPFKICLSDGSSHSIRHPELVMVSRREVIVAVGPMKSNIPDDTVFINPIHITRIELLNGKSRKRRSDKRR